PENRVRGLRHARPPFCQTRERPYDERREGMTPMHWPGTTAVLEPAAGLKARAGGAAPSRRDGRAPGPGPLTMAGVPSGLGLPCRDDPEMFFAEAPEDVEY